MKVWIKIQKVEREESQDIIVGICDENLLGFESGDFKISEQFFMGELVDIEKGLKKIKGATIINLFGENIISEAIKKELIETSSVKKIKKIPHTQIITI